MKDSEIERNLRLLGLETSLQIRSLMPEPFLGKLEIRFVPENLMPIVKTTNDMKPCQLEPDRSADEKPKLKIQSMEGRAKCTTNRRTVEIMLKCIPDMVLRVRITTIEATTENTWLLSLHPPCCEPTITHGSQKGPLHARSNKWKETATGSNNASGAMKGKSKMYPSVHPSSQIRK